jgi:hypothetical protein
VKHGEARIDTMSRVLSNASGAHDIVHRIIAQRRARSFSDRSETSMT